MKLTRETSLLLGGVSTLAAAIGAGVSYYYTKRYVTAQYENIITDEIAAVKKHYALIHKKDEYADPEELVNHYETLVDDLGYSAKGTEAVKPSSAILSGALLSGQNFDYDFELSIRTAEGPFILHKNEFFQNEIDYRQETLIYYEEDDVLTDERDEVIDDVDKCIGAENLSRFGHGSSDNNVVYVRNPVMEMDYEVVRRKGSYVREVLGFIEHSEPKRPRKFRRDYE